MISDEGTRKTSLNRSSVLSIGKVRTSSNQKKNSHPRFTIKENQIFTFCFHSMLLIGDIHINFKEKDRILQMLKEKIDQYPEEKNIIFLGDYVYSF